MAVKKVFICDCCNEEIPNHFYKIQGFNVYLNDSSYRVDDMIVCDNCLLEIMKEIKKRKTVQFDLEIG